MHNGTIIPSYASSTWATSLSLSVSMIRLHKEQQKGMTAVQKHCINGLPSRWLLHRGSLCIQIAKKTSAVSLLTGKEGVYRSKNGKRRPHAGRKSESVCLLVMPQSYSKWELGSLSQRAAHLEMISFFGP